MRNGRAPHARGKPPPAGAYSPAVGLQRGPAVGLSLLCLLCLPCLQHGWATCSWLVLPPWPRVCNVDLLLGWAPCWRLGVLMCMQAPGAPCRACCACSTSPGRAAGGQVRVRSRVELRRCGAGWYVRSFDIGYLAAWRACRWQCHWHDVGPRRACLLYP
jgi:hypothetical protein